MQLILTQPANHQDVERWACRVLRKHCQCPGLAPFGRNGQRQDGIDLHGFCIDGTELAVQVKQRQKGKLKTQVLRDDFNAALVAFPTLKRFIFVTTHERDASLQREVMDMCRQSLATSDCRVEIMFWDSITDIIQADAEFLSDYLDLAARGIGLRATSPELRPADAVTLLEDSPEFSKAIKEIREGRAQTAIGMLDTLRRQQWESSAALFKYRLEGNLAQAYLALGRWNDAAEHFLAAGTHVRSSSALAMRSRGLSLQGDAKGALAAAEEAVALDPKNARAWACLVTQLREEPYQTTKDRVPAGLHADAEVAVALSYAAMHSSRADDAITHLRQALTAEPGWNVALVNLAALLLQKAKGTAWLLNGPTADATAGVLLNEADKLLTECLESKECGEDEFRSTSLYNRSSVRRLLGRESDADTDLEAAFSVSPKDGKIAFGTALRASERGDHARAINILRELSQDPAFSSKCHVFIADIYRAKGDPESRTAALQELEAASGAMPPDDPDLHVHALVQTVTLACELQPDRYRDDSLPSSHYSGETESLRSLFDAIYWSSRNQVEKAIAVLSSVAARPPQQLGPVGVEAAAKLAFRVRRPDLAASLLDRAQTECCFQIDQAQFAFALFQASRFRDVLRVCREARQRGALERVFMSLEVNVLLSHEADEQAVDVLTAWLQSHPSDQEAMFARASIAYSAGDSRWAQQLFAALPEPEAVAIASAPHYAMLVLEASAWTEQQRFRCIYRLWRRHREHAVVWKALLHAVYGRKTDRSVHEGIAKASEYTAVQIKRATRAEPEWVVLVPSGDPLAEPPEVHVESKLGQSLVGKRVGDSVEVADSLGEIDAVILKIVSAELFAASRCLEEGGDRFPGELLLRKISISDLNDASTRDEVVAAFEPFTKMLQERQDRIGHVESAFRDGEASVFQLSRVTGEEELERIDGILHHSTLRLRAVHKNDADAFALKDICVTANPFVLSPSAVVVLGRLALLETAAETLDLRAPRMLRRQVQAVIRTISDDRWGQWVSAKGKVPVLSESAEDVRAALLEFWQSVERVLRAVAEHDGFSLFELDQKEMAHAVRVIGGASIRSIALAKIGDATLLSDEWAVSGFGAERFGVRTLSTNGLISALLQSGKLSQASADEACAKLIGLNIIGVDFNRDVVVAGIRAAGWNPAGNPARRCIETLGEVSIPHRDVAWITAGVIAKAWREIVADEQRLELVNLCLGALLRRGQVDPKGFMLMLEQAFGVDPLGADGAKMLVVQWLMRKRSS